MTMNRQAGGFTLIEVLIALFLMGLALLAAAPMFVSAVKVTASGADYGSVGARAVDWMEDWRRPDWFGLPAGGSLTTNVPGYYDLTQPPFTVRWTIVDNATPATLKTITCRVIATRTSIGLQKEITLVTLRAK